ncbi:MAG: DUF3006 domain-containing protein [Ruminococcus sp.]|nr:DUF3006 domain-containing protein [Ruminococcus sp.]
MFYSVDRADKDYVMICDDDGDTKEVRSIHFEGDVSPGQVYRFEQGRFIYDDEETTKRRRKMTELQRELFNKRKCMING